MRARATSERSELPGRVEERRDSLRVVNGIVAMDQHPGLSISDSCMQSADGRGHNRRATCLGLQRDKPERFGMRRNDGQIRSAEPFDQHVLGGRRLEPYDVGDTEMASEISKRFGSFKPGPRWSTKNRHRDALASRGILLDEMSNCPY
jgi:hypothetical protein